MTEKTDHSALVTALLDAHVKFVIDELTGPTLPATLEAMLDAALSDASRIRFGDVVSPAIIKATARTYAIDLNLKGGIPELVGEIARTLHAHPIHERVALGDLLSDRRVADVVDYALEFRELRARVLRAMIASPLYEAFASELLYNGIRDYLASGARGLPGGRSALELGRALVGRASPGLESTLEEGLLRYIARTVRSLSEKTAQPLLDGEHDETLRELLLDSWDRVRGTTLGELREDVTEDDLEEVFVTGHELWNELRRTELIGTMIDTAIDALFEKYGEVSLAELLEDLGITREIMLGEALRYGPTVLAAMHRDGHLEPPIRRMLRPFYESGIVARVLEAHLASSSAPVL